jgi:hypothetical protein
MAALIDLTIKANCAIEPVLFDAPNAPQPPEYDCAMNPNANPGAAASGEGFSGPLVGGSLSLSTPFGDKTVGIIGSSIGFRRLPCLTDSCAFTLTALEIDFEDFGLGPLIITDLHAELVDPALGIIRDDTTATIEDREVHMEVTFGIALKNPKSDKVLFTDKNLPVLVSNDGPVTMNVDNDSNIQIVEASFTFPSNVKTHLATAAASCSPE